MKTHYQQWLEEAAKNTPDFKPLDYVMINGDDSGRYKILSKMYEPQLGRDIFVLAQGDKVRYAIFDNMKDA